MPVDPAAPRESELVCLSDGCCPVDLYYVWAKCPIADQDAAEEG